MSQESIEMNDLMFMALDHAIASIEDASGPLIPFAITLSNSGEKKLQRFALDLLEESEAAAKTHIDHMKDEIRTYAIAWDGFLTMEGKRWDAVFIEAGEAQTETGALIAQRYETKGIFKKKNIPAGNPALIEKPSSRVFRT